MANGELFAVAEVLNWELHERVTDLFIFTDSMVTLHLIRKGMHRPFLLVGHEHEGTIFDMLTKVKQLEDQGVTVHLHKVLAHSGVRGNERADAAAKFACDDEAGACTAPGKVVVDKEYPCWIEVRGTGVRLADRQSVVATVGEARQGRIA